MNHIDMDTGKTSISHPWWKHAVIYHIYPRSFCDTDGDGIGDLAGILHKVPYLKDLGVDALWMGPVFSSPHIDNGYDTSDYRKIDPFFGTQQGMYALIEEAHRHGIRVLLDLVFNHTSDQHTWFTQSKVSRNGPYADYYIWKDPKPDGSPPNNWRAAFGGGAWSYCVERKQYYLHLFSPQQPDLNWENPSVRIELAEIANFWLERGVDGFRLDVINFISKEFGEGSGRYIDGPHVLSYLQEFRSRLIRHDEIVLVGETPGVSIDIAKEYVDPRNKALDLVLNFDHLMVDQEAGSKWAHRDWSMRELMKVLGAWQSGLGEHGWNSLYMSNHDQPRVVSRFGNDSNYRYESATALATLFYLLRGTPIVYQGDELGMANFPIAEPKHFVDLESRNAFHELVNLEKHTIEQALCKIRWVARDNGRTPFQWCNGKHAGFTDAEQPWYPVNPDYEMWNAALQQENPHKSVFKYYQRLLWLTRTTIFRNGDYQMLSCTPRAVAYIRWFNARAAVVLVNLSEQPETLALSSAKLNQLIGNGRLSVLSNGDKNIEFYEEYVRLLPFAATVLTDQSIDHRMLEHDSQLTS